MGVHYRHSKVCPRPRRAVVRWTYLHIYFYLFIYLFLSPPTGIRSPFTGGLLLLLTYADLSRPTQTVHMYVHVAVTCM